MLENLDRIELDKLAQRVRDNEAAIDKLVLKLNELARFSARLRSALQC